MKQKIANTKASNLSIQLVKLLLRQPDTTSYQQAARLRYAARKQIPPDALAEALAKKGNGIAEWAARFSREFPTKQRAASSSASGDWPMGPGDDHEPQEPDASNDDDSDDLADDYEDGEGNESDAEEEDDAASDQPDVDWGPNALKKWRKCKVDGGAWLFIKKLSEDRARIIKKSRSK